MLAAIVEARESSPILITSCRDRKSTRLNPSHLVISYAVFCLKKKKNYLLSRVVTTCSIALYNTHASALFCDTTIAQTQSSTTTTPTTSLLTHSCTPITERSRM